MKRLAYRLRKIAKDICAMEKEPFNVQVSKGNETFDITISPGSDGKWHEEVHGNTYFKPKTYMGYLNQDDILNWLSEDFDEVKLVSDFDDEGEEISDEMSKDDLIDELWDRLSGDLKPFRTSEAIAVLKKFGAEVNKVSKVEDDGENKEYLFNVTFNDESFDINFTLSVVQDDETGRNRYSQLDSISLE